MLGSIMQNMLDELQDVGRLDQITLGREGSAGLIAPCLEEMHMAAACDLFSDVVGVVAFRRFSR